MKLSTVKEISRYAWAVGIAWSALIAGSLAWNVVQHQKSVQVFGRVKAMTAFERDRLYRLWVSRQGGVYAPVTPTLQPNPLLSHVPERDIATPSGTHLTLVNATYLSRMVFASLDRPEQFGIGHITSLNPLNPENAPDPWEAKALKAFEEGVKEVSEIQTINGRPYMRLLRVATTEPPCLKCHGNQGYRKGEIRGGVGVSVPIAEIQATMRPIMTGTLVSHGLIWILGVGALFVGTRKINSSVSALQRSEERFRAVVEDQTETICRMQADGTFAFVNDVYCRVFGMESSELVGKKWQPRAVPEDLPMVEEKLAALSPANPVVVVENRIFSTAGEVRWMQFVNRGFFDRDGHLLEIQSVGRDITDYRRTQEDLHSSEVRFSTIFRSNPLPIGIMRLDDARFVEVNDAFVDAFGYRPEEVIGRTSLEFSLWSHVGQRDRFLEMIRDKGRVHQLEVELQRKSGDAGHFLMAAEVIELRGEKYVMGMLSDISSRKKSEETLREANAGLEREVRKRTAALLEANELLTQEIEVRIQIENEILAQQAKLQDVALELSLAEERERIRIAGELHDQVGQRLILAKMKADALESRLHTEPLRADAEAVASLVEQSIQDLRTYILQMRPPLLANAGLEAALQWLGEELRNDYDLVVEFQDDAEPKPLKYEIRSTVYQAVRELLLNVAKHARTNRALVTLSREEETMVIVVSDYGIGMEHPEAVLAPSKIGGFGLFNSRQRIEYLGGSLVLESAPGRGTRATLRVPLDQTGEIAAESSPPADSGC